jgi:predicted HicB family RNase H-like nuclease
MGARYQGLDKVLYARVTPKAIRAYNRAAKRAKIGLAEWVRSVLDSAALPPKRVAPAGNKRA